MDQKNDESYRKIETFESESNLVVMVLVVVGVVVTVNLSQDVP
jgi:hypothetical protein